MKNVQILFSSDSYDYMASFYASHADGKMWFELDATCKRTGRTSAINTVNDVISYFCVNQNEERFEGSSWRLMKEEILGFRRWVNMLVDMDDLSWLDEALDADRREGEWENLAGGE